ncbi:hypothetical protein BJX76DRAFT_128380 [Aspergillus varians]
MVTCVDYLTHQQLATLHQNTQISGMQATELFPCVPSKIPDTPLQRDCSRCRPDSLLPISGPVISCLSPSLHLFLPNPLHSRCLNPPIISPSHQINLFYLLLLRLPSFLVLTSSSHSFTAPRAVSSTRTAPQIASLYYPYAHRNVAHHSLDHLCSEQTAISHPRPWLAADHQPSRVQRPARAQYHPRTSRVWLVRISFASEPYLPC